MPLVSGEYLAATDDNQCASRSAAEIISDLGLSGYGNLTTAEAQQLQNIGSSAIDVGAWTSLGAWDQSLASTASPQFASVTIGNEGIGVGTGTTGLTIQASATNKIGFYGSTPVTRQPAVVDAETDHSFNLVREQSSWVLSYELNYYALEDMELAVEALATKLNTAMTKLRTCGLAA